MKLTLLGTGNVRGCPVYGCECPACQQASLDPSKARLLCSAMLELNGQQILIDASHPQLQTRFPAGTIDAILLTHFHMDHVQALFELRWGLCDSIPVYHPDDPLGCDDLFKHPGILDFQPALTAMQAFQLAEISVTPLALNHSKPTLGYLFSSENGCIAYLTDTLGIPDKSWQQLLRRPPKYVVIDCSASPLHSSSNHNNLKDVLNLAHALPDSMWVLTHIGHDLDEYLMQHPRCLPSNVLVGHDELCLNL